MRHAQTNLQLYWQLIDAAWDEASIAMVRRGYELAIQLFADSYRPSQKPFVSHLVGTASALASWGERPALVAAGLLHSAYLYGHFGDGKKNITARRQHIVAKAIGAEAEELVRAYSLYRRDEVFQRWCSELSLSPAERDQAALQCADLYDDCGDGEPFVTRKKRLVLDLPWNLAGREAIGRLAAHAIGESAAAALAQRFQEFAGRELPDCLRSDRGSSGRVTAGVGELRTSALSQQLRRAARLFRRKQAA